MASTATQKGNRGQRAAISVIKKWTHKKFKSSAQYGGGGYNMDPHKGDVLCDTEGHYFPFTVEVKFYKEINFCQLLQPNLKNVLILDFWAQCLGDAKRCKKIPMLMMRFNGLPKDFFFVVIDQHFLSLIEPQIRLWAVDTKILFYEDRERDLFLALMPSTDFFATKYKEVKKIAKTHIKTKYA